MKKQKEITIADVDADLKNTIPYGRMKLAQTAAVRAYAEMERAKRDLAEAEDLESRMRDVALRSLGSNTEAGKVSDLADQSEAEAVRFENDLQNARKWADDCGYENLKYGHTALDPYFTGEKDPFAEQILWKKGPGYEVRGLYGTKPTVHDREQVDTPRDFPYVEPVSVSPSEVSAAAAEFVSDHGQDMDDAAGWAKAKTAKSEAERALETAGSDLAAKMDELHDARHAVAVAEDLAVSKMKARLEAEDKKRAELLAEAEAIGNKRGGLFAGLFGRGE